MRWPWEEAENTDVDYDAIDIQPDHNKKAHRELIAHLREQHLPGADDDDAAAVSLEIEQARLVLLAAGGLLGVTLTTSLNVTRAVCTPPLYAEVPALFLALMLAWAALSRGAALRSRRVARRYDIYNYMLDEYLSAEQQGRPPDHKDFYVKADRAFIRENNLRAFGRWLRNGAGIMAGVGIALAIWAAAGTINAGLCPVSRKTIAPASSKPQLQQGDAR